MKTLKCKNIKLKNTYLKYLNPQAVRAKWNDKIPWKKRPLGPSDHLCALHFQRDEIITHKIIKLKDGSTYKAPTIHHIRDGCFPSKFPGLKSFSQEARKRRPSPKKRNTLMSSKSKRNVNSKVQVFTEEEKQCTQNYDMPVELPADASIREQSLHLSTSAFASKKENRDKQNSNYQVIIQLRDGTKYKAPILQHFQEGCTTFTFTGSKYLLQDNSKRMQYFKEKNSLISLKRRKILNTKIHTKVEEGEMPSRKTLGIQLKFPLDASVAPALKRKNSGDKQNPLEGNVGHLDEHSYVVKSAFTLKEIRNQAKDVVLPDNMWGVHFNKEKVAFVHISDSFQTDKTIVFSDSMYPNISITIKTFKGEEVKSKAQLEALLRKLHSYRACIGITDNGDRSVKCMGYMEYNGRKLPNKCLYCEVEKKRTQIFSKKSATARERIQRLRKELKMNSQQKGRLEKRVNHH